VPLTPSHVVVALPFIRTPLLPGAISIGAMAPDLPIYLRDIGITRDMTHFSVLVSGLVAFVLLSIWYGLLRPAARELSPGWLARRLPTSWDATGLAVVDSLYQPRPGLQHPNWRNRAVFGALVAVSLILGVVTHLVWDAFTHDDGFGMRIFPALLENWGSRPGYFWMQNISSLLGLVILAIFAVRWLRRQPNDVALARILPGWLRTTLWCALPVVLFAALGWGIATYGPLRPGYSAEHLAYQVLPPAFAMWGMLVAAMCLIVLILRQITTRHARV
jgi:hypothetical protein